jgi:hypothetical protein
VHYLKYFTDINESNVDAAQYSGRIGIFDHKKDKDGKTILTLLCKHHEKGKQDLNEIKRYVVYWFEKLQRYENVLYKPFFKFFTSLGNLMNIYVKNKTILSNAVKQNEISNFF